MIRKVAGIAGVAALAASACFFAACSHQAKAPAQQETASRAAAQITPQIPATVAAPGTPDVPPFAHRSEIPASGKQGPPGEAAKLAGDADRGEPLFVADCATCHGPQGTDKVENPGSSDGTVPPLNPIDPGLKGTTPAAFASRIDPLIQHGSVPDGRNPMLFMPDWGDSKTLTQQQIADLEAYIIRLNK